LKCCECVAIWTDWLIQNVLLETDVRRRHLDPDGLEHGGRHGEGEWCGSQEVRLMDPGAAVKPRLVTLDLHRLFKSPIQHMCNTHTHTHTHALSYLQTRLKTYETNLTEQTTRKHKDGKREHMQTHTRQIQQFTVLNAFGCGEGHHFFVLTHSKIK